MRDFSNAHDEEDVSGTHTGTEKPSGGIGLGSVRRGGASRDDDTDNADIVAPGGELHGSAGESSAGKKKIAAEQESAGEVGHEPLVTSVRGTGRAAGEPSLASLVLDGGANAFSEPLGGGETTPALESVPVYTPIEAGVVVGGKARRVSGGLKGRASKRLGHAPEEQAAWGEQKIDAMQKKVAQVGGDLLERVRNNAADKVSGMSLQTRIRKGFYGSVLVWAAFWGGSKIMSHVWGNSERGDAGQSTWVVMQATRVSDDATGAQRRGEQLAGRAIREEVLAQVRLAKDGQTGAGQRVLINILGMQVIEDARREDAKAVLLDESRVVQIYGSDNQDVGVASVQKGAFMALSALGVKGDWRDHARRASQLIEDGGHQPKFGGEMSEDLARAVRAGVEEARIKTLHLRGDERVGANRVFDEVIRSLDLAIPLTRKR